MLLPFDADGLLLYFGFELGVVDDGVKLGHDFVDDVPVRVLLIQ